MTAQEIIEKIRAEIERQEKQCSLDTYEGRHKLFILGGLKTRLSDLEKEEKPSEGLEDILLEFYDEYDSNVENRPIIPRIYAEKLSRHFAKWGEEHAKECDEKPNKVKADFDIYRFQQKFCIHCEIPHCTGTIDYLKSCPYLNK